MCGSRPIPEGAEHCTIGFLPRHVAARPQECTCFHNKFAQIIELYANSPNGLVKQNKSRNHGMASYSLLDNIPELEKG